ncbi:MAG TPA: HAD family hydrolase [Rubrivivax sp.]|nr:HAD family hydrolase [Rubrivivax sp.]
MNLTLFDLDGTLLAIDSDHAFGEFMVRLGWADGETFRRANDEFYAQYQAERLDVDAYIRFATAAWRERSEAELADASRRFVEEIIRPALHDSALALVRRHVEAGDLVAIVTATNEFVTRPVAALFGIDELIATELQRDAHGRVTGAIRGVPSFREGKVTRVQQWLQRRGRRCADFGRTTFYSDSTNDLALLERVSHPVATNPAPALERMAGARGWPILRLFA